MLDAIDAPRLAGPGRGAGRSSCCKPSSTRRWPPSRTCFGIDDALDAINQKLVRRHPHVFGDGRPPKPPATCSRIWGEVKAEEKKRQGRTPDGGLLDSVPRALPALVEAQQITSRAAHVRFDWDNAEQVLEKLHEELAEFDAARRGTSQEDLEGELGDMLFVLVNLARFVKVDPEQALRKTNAKFRRRFGHIERRLGEQGKSPEEATLTEMDALWEESKR